MREYLAIRGEHRLSGSLAVSGSKNAALPLMMATILSAGECRLRNVPNLEDISVSVQLLRSLGGEVEFRNNELRTRMSAVQYSNPPFHLVKALRASFWAFGPLIARTGSCRIALPGGDAIGSRPVDLHIRGLVAMGVEVRYEQGVVIGSAPGGLRPASIELEFPSVGATHHLLMTAALIPGTTVIRGAAKEPEIVQVAEFLTAMGAVVERAGTSTIVITGCQELGGAALTVMGDRIEAATYLLAGAVTRGAVTVRGIGPEALSGVLELLVQAGCDVLATDDRVMVSASERLRAVSFETAPFPGVATDVQPLLVAALATATGESRARETVFENRFGHVAEYKKCGADIRVAGDTAIITGVERLRGAPVDAIDIRAAAGLIILGCAASGVTEIHDIHHLDRGYENLVQKIRALGGNILRVPAFDGKELNVGW